MPITPRFRGLRFLRLGRQNCRREVIDLLGTPTDTLRRLRLKSRAGRVLSRAEWTAVAQLAQLAVEAVATTNPNHLSTDALTAVLDAFAVIYDVRTDQHTRHDVYFLGNLPAECRAAGATLGVPLSQAVRTTVAEARRRLGDGRARCLPWLAARNLAVLLAEAPLPGAAVIHRALRPHWPALWWLALQGHNALTGEALPEVSPREALEANDRRS